ncbi:MAG TPA: RseA family anti-sigma factor, partial [Nitriliruptorales bacterium]
METGERLSAYLAGELDADETAALEVELAGDPALRARLERIRAADQALRSLPPVAPPAEFSMRLREALAHEVTRHEASPGADELAQRRLRRDGRIHRFVGLGVAAAAVAV